MGTHQADCLLLLVLVGGAGPTTLSGQGPAPVLSYATAHPELHPAEARWGTLPDTVRTYRASYWQEGLFIGGGVAGLFGAALGGGFCSMSESSNDNCTLAAISGFAIMGGAGASLGALIGGLFPKSPRQSSSH